MTSSVGMMDTIRLYAGKSSIKCLPKIIKSRTIIQRCVWIAALICGICVVLYQLANLIMGFREYKVSRSMASTMFPKLHMFPDVTLCNQNPLWSSSGPGTLRAHVRGYEGSLTFADYETKVLAMYSGILEKSDLNHVDKKLISYEFNSMSGYLRHVILHPEVVERLRDEFVWDCVWELDGYTMKNCTNIEPVLVPRVGLCFTVRLPDVLINLDHSSVALSVMLYLNNINTVYLPEYLLSPTRSYASGVKVITHQRQTVPLSEDSIGVSAGRNAAFKIYLSSHQYMKDPYGKCEDENRLPQDGDTQPTTSDGALDYTVMACIALCTQQQILERCGCVSSTLLTWPGDHHRMCAVLDLTDMNSTLDEIKCVAEVIKAHSPTCINHCPPNCTEHVYHAEANQVSDIINI